MLTVPYKLSLMLENYEHGVYSQFCYSRMVHSSLPLAAGKGAVLLVIVKFMLAI